jgi:beta-hydroxyacyl-ACP dehydratase FabZ
MSVMSIDDILKILPHRAPMVFVDRVIECDDQKKIVAIKNVTINEPFFQGHFPAVPVMPGVLQLEAMAQVGGILLIRVAKLDVGVPYLMMIDKARFRKVVQPGDQLRIEVELTNMRSRSARFKGTVSVDGSVVSEAELMCMITDKAAGNAS